MIDGYRLLVGGESIDEVTPGFFNALLKSPSPSRCLDGTVFFQFREHVLTGTSQAIDRPSIGVIDDSIDLPYPARAPLSTPQKACWY